jgi:phosphoglycerol transferase MdoB-like AlkP superfamily enzyme
VKRTAGSQRVAAFAATAWLGCAGLTLAAPPEIREVPPWESHGFSVLAADPPRVGFAGQTVYRRVVVRNDGSLAWGGAFRVSYHWRDRQGRLVEFEGERTELPAPVRPGASAEVALRILLPARAGLYRLEIDLVHEAVRWFSLTDPTRVPTHAALVLPDWSASAGAVLPAFVAALAAVWSRRRPTADAWTRAALLGWLGASLLTKPIFLYAEMGTSPAPPAGLLGALAVLVALLLLAPLPRRILAVAAWSLAAATSLFVWADLLYFRFFDDLISLGVLRATGNLGDLGGAVRDLAHAGDALLFLDLPFGLVLAAGAARVSAGRRWLWALPAAALVLAVGASVRLRDPRPQPRNEVRTALLERRGFWPFYAEEAIATVVEAVRPAQLSAADRAEVAAWFAATRGERSGRPPWFGVARDRNLLLVQVESMQGFLVGLTVDGQEITPHLNRLARAALYFPNFFDQTGAGRSSAGDFIAQTSVLPVAESIAYSAPGMHFDTIASELAARGYTTLSAIPFRASFWNRRLTHPTYGFATSLFRDTFADGERVGWGLSDREFFRQMRPRLAALPTPWCVWLTTLSLHFPYERFPGSLEVLELGELEGKPMGNYLHGMHLFDRALGELLGGLAQDGLLDTTVVAIWGDHDSGLVWDPGRPLGDRRLAKVRKRLLDRVPFVVRVPGNPAPAGTYDLPAGHLDIGPTLLALLGVDPAPLTLQGRNLLGDPAERPIVHPGGSWVTRRRLWMEDGSCWELPELRGLPAAACAPDDRAADHQIWVARLLLRYDLQRAVAAGPEGF